MALVTLSTSDVFKDGTGTPIANGVLVLALLGPQNPEVLFTGLHAQRIASFTLNASGQLTGTPQIYGSDQLDSNEIYFWEVFRDSTLLAPVAAVGPLTGQLLNTTDSQPVSLLNHPAAGGSPVITAQGFPAGNPTTQVLPLPPTVLQPKNTVLAGPTSGADAPATFRSLVTADLPSSAALKPATTDAIQYVTTGGNDLNDGLSRGTAKATIQAALNALPATGGVVYLAAGGTWSISSTIVASSTTGPIYHLIGDCPATRDDNSGGTDKHVVINYTGTGTALKSNAFASIQNLYLVGPSSAGTTIGIDCNGAGTTFRNVNIGGFGTGWFLDSGCFLVSYEDGSIHDNGTNIGSAVTPTSAGENISFIGVLISDNAANTNATSINFVTSPGPLDIKFVNCSFDGVGLTIGSAGNFSFLGCHFEISNSGTHVVPVQITHNQCNVSFVGCRMLQDTGGSTAAEFILNNANLGNNILIAGGNYSQGSTSMTNVVTNGPGDPAAKLTLIGITTDIAVRQSGTWAQVIDLDLGQINNGEIMSETGTGFGNGAAGTAVTTTLKGTGSGPTTPQTVVKYVSIDVAGVTYWVPLVQ